jgi:hypothetical protein
MSQHGKKNISSGGQGPLLDRKIPSLSRSDPGSQEKNWAKARIFLLG